MNVFNPIAANQQILMNVLFLVAIQIAKSAMVIWLMEALLSQIRQQDMPVYLIVQKTRHINCILKTEKLVVNRLIFA